VEKNRRWRISECRVEEEDSAVGFFKGPQLHPFFSANEEDFLGRGGEGEKKESPEQ
jgi:hypothetical protein